MGVVIAAAILVAILLWPALAAAQPRTDAKAVADMLFDEGKRLLAAGDVNHACPKFEASLQVLDQLGVRLNLADCHERLGRLATAWAEFREAAAQADKRGDSRAGYARQRAEVIEPLLARLQLTIADADRLPGLEIRRDGVVLPADDFGVPLPVDPGNYKIDARAPGHRPWSTQVTLAKPAETIIVTVPHLAAAPAPDAAHPDVAAAPAAPDAPDDDAPVAPARHQRQVLGFAVGAGGFVAFAVGVGLGLDAKHKWDSAGAHCQGTTCDATGISINHSARNLGTAGTIVGGVGVAALAAGAILYFTAPAARPLAEHARLDLDPTGIHIGYQARF